MNGYKWVIHFFVKITTPFHAYKYVLLVPILLLHYGLKVAYYYKCYRKQREDITLITLHVKSGKDKGKTRIVDLDLDSTDKAIILLITRGYSSAYSIWTTMKRYAKDEDIVILMEEENKKSVMTYKNINKRVIKLSKRGLIEEIKQPDPNTINLHGRKDYKLTMKGALCLQDHIIAHRDPDDIREIVGYLIKNKLDMPEFTKLLNDRLTFTIRAVDLYRTTIGMDRFKLEWDKEGQITKFIDGTPPPSKKKH